MKRRTGLLKIACLISLGAVVAGAANVGALGYQSNVGVGFTFEPTLNVTLSSADLTISDLTPNSGAKDSNIITVGVSTNAAYGYNLLATAGNVTNATTNLVNGGNSFAALSSNVSGLNGFSDNTWGYSYCVTNCSTTSNWVSGSQGSTSEGYAGLPLYTGTGVQLTSADDKTSSSAQFKIAAKAGATQASGEYTNVVNFTAVSKVGAVTLLDAFVASGATQHNGHYTMQGMTPAICNMADKGSSIQLVDIRDSKMYWVTKLDDGKCWMTSNLDLDIGGLYTEPLNSNNTDISTDSNVYASSGIYPDYSVSDGVYTWNPVSTVKTSSYYIDNTSVKPSGWPTDNNGNTKPYSAEGKDNYYYSSNSTSNDTRYTSLKACTDASHSEAECKRYFAGNYYNWTAAIASNNSTNISTAGTIASNSICPKGWRLPNASQTNNEYNEFGIMFYKAGIAANLSADNDSVGYKDGGFNKLRSNPYYFTRSGVINGGTLNYPGVYGSYWSSTVSSSAYAYYLFFNDTGIYPARSYDRCIGWSVRCLARSE